MSTQDRVYAEPQRQIVDFVFDEKVVAVFPDMIRRSIPGYETIIPLTGLIAAHHASGGGNCYDLGCSLGASSLAILRQMPTPHPETFQIIGVDNSSAMLEKARQNLADHENITFVESDIRQVEFAEIAVVVLNFTLQFIPPGDRLDLLTRIRRNMLPHGIVIVSEKIRFDKQDQQNYFNERHLEFKRANGYSELEISQKRNALEKVMLPDTISAHQERFQTAGFSVSETWFRCLNWASFLAHP